MKNKKVPLRKCVACGEQKDKRELIRIVNNKEEGILFDITGKKNGRGAYLCKSKVCIQKSKKNKRLNTALESEINNDFYDNLERFIDSSK